MIETAVILAAGRGSRLAPAEADDRFSKPLVRVAGVSLLQRSIDACRGAGARRIIIVTGYRAKLIDAEVARLDRGDLETVFNPDWQLANGVSLLSCRDLLDGEFALAMSDHVFDTTIMNDLLRLELLPGSVTLAVDHKVASVVELDEANKVCIDRGRITAIGKTLSAYSAIDIGLFACTPEFLSALESVRAHRGDCSITEGVLELCAAGRFLAYDIGDRWWLNINTPRTLRRAEQRLAGASPGGVGPRAATRPLPD